MSINLANVNISLREFQNIASGKYNAGEVKLASETRLDKVNNHVHSKWRNNETTSHEEIMAVKNAFVRALGSSGVAGDELASVRARLGLTAETGGAVDRTLAERAMKPLTRQEVREILDRYAGTINESVGAGTISTAAEMNARVSERERANRAARRTQVNESLDGNRAISINRDVELFGRIVAGNFEGVRRDEVVRLLELVQGRLAALRAEHGGNPPADDRPELVLELQGGQKVEFQSPVSTAALMARLEDAEFYLTYRPYYNEDGTYPQMTHAEWNEAVKKSISSSKGPQPLPHEVREVVKSVLAEARAKFGPEIIAEDACVGVLMPNKLQEEFDRLADEAGEARRITMDDVRSVLRNLVARHAANKTVQLALAAAAEKAGVKFNFAKYAEALLKRDTALDGAIARAKTPAEVALALEQSAASLEKMVRLGAKLELLTDSLDERIAAAYSAKLGLPVPALANHLLVYNLSSSMRFFLDNLASGKIPCETPEEAEAALDAKIEENAAKRLELLGKAETYGLGADSVVELKTIVLGVGSVKSDVFDLDKFRAIADEIKPALSALKNALSAPNLAKDAGLAALKTFATAMQDAIARQFGHLLTDENFIVSNAALVFALNSDKSPVETALAFIGTLDQADFVDIHATYLDNIFNKAVPSAEAYNETLVGQLGRPKLPPLHAAALVRAGRDAGLTAATDAEILAIFDQSKPAGGELAEALAASPVAVSPQMLQSLAYGTLRHYGPAIQNGAVPPVLANPVAQ